MTSAQKIIKYLAIAFAIFLIITIISTLLGVLYALSGVLGLRTDDETGGPMTTTSFENADITALEINIDYTNLTIKTGEFFKVETNNSDISCKQSNDKLVIEDKNYNWFGAHNNEDLIVYIPEGIDFERVEINAGAGKIDIENLTAEKLSFELGAGETEVKSLTVTNKCEIEGGAGRVNILSGTIKDLDLDMGIGEVNLSCKLTGKTDINAGVGNLNINLQGAKESYKIKADKGIGTIKIDGRDISNSETYGNGDSYIDVDGGIGNIDIEFQ